LKTRKNTKTTRTLLTVLETTGRVRKHTNLRVLCFSSFKKRNCQLYLLFNNHHSCNRCLPFHCWNVTETKVFFSFGLFLTHTTDCISNCCYRNQTNIVSGLESDITVRVIVMRVNPYQTISKQIN
jgi:hypothetical protein